MTPRSIHLIALSGLPLVQPGDDLARIVSDGLERHGLALEQDDVLVLAQKIVSKAEDRRVRLAQVAPSSRAVEMAALTGKDPRMVELVLRESAGVLRFRAGVLIVEHRLGFIMANAGIDMSNVDQERGETALLLPLDPDASCSSIRSALQARWACEVGVIINDSHGRAWRNGTVGVALGAAGLPALQDLRGRPDLFGRQLLHTEVGLADELASAASLLMGQAAEGCPVVLVRGMRWERREGRARDLIRPAQMDLFR